jgi:hypothetical protein
MGVLLHPRIISDACVHSMAGSRAPGVGCWTLADAMHYCHARCMLGTTSTCQCRARCSCAAQVMKGCGM